MASKFQNRLVGTVILVAIGVIVLPGLLDGQKKHYKDDFAAIPLVPKAGEQQDEDIAVPVTQPLPEQPPQSAASAVNDNHLADEQHATEIEHHQPSMENTPTAVPPPPKPQTTKPQVQPTLHPKPKVTAQTKTPPPAKMPEQMKPPASAKPKAEQHIKTVTPEKPKERAKSEQPSPTAQAWVVQLGALKNAAKVNEIVAKLRLSGYRVSTTPGTPVAGQITRIYVGPDASKARMQAAVAELRSLSGLSGVVKPWSPR